MSDANQNENLAHGNSADPTTPVNPTGNASISHPPSPSKPTYPTGTGDKTKTEPPASA